MRGARREFRGRSGGRLRITILIGIVLIALLGLAIWQWEWDIRWLEHWIAAHRFLGAVLYVLAITASVVLLPFSSLPLLPLAARSYGVVGAALLSAAGWWAGALVAFQIARLGRGYLEGVASLDAVDRLESKVPKDIGFGGIVVLRMILPVDVVSFALGLLKRLAFMTYATASLVGIVPFAFVWSYAGGQLGAGRYVSFAAVVLAIAGVGLLGRHVWRARR
jgi:uncharacterized membrane protein YdjX (TVP38/TMEM64 family)